jgi:hypothetical protein
VFIVHLAHYRFAALHYFGRPIPGWIVLPAVDPLARLRIMKHGIPAVDFLFDREIARVRCITMALQRRPHGSIIHLAFPVRLLAITSAPLNSLWPCATARNRALFPIAPVVAS